MWARFSALVLLPAFLFFLEGLRAYLAVLFALASDALHPTTRPEAVLLALAPLVALLAPAVPLPRLLGRRGAVAASVALLAVARVPLSLGPLAVQGVSASAVVAGGALLLVTAAGYVERRGLAAAFIGAVLADQLLRLAGTSWDLSLRPGWVPIQIVLSLLVLGLLGEWLRLPEQGPVGSTLERRAGGLRMRGGIALVGLLFLEAAVLSSAAALSRLAGIPYAASGVLLMVAGALALALSLLGIEPHRWHRHGALLLGAVVAIGAAAPWWVRGWSGAALAAAGHTAALLLVNAALAPAGGRRPGAALLPGLGALLGFHALYAAAYFPGHTFSFLEGAAPWVVLGASVVLLVSVALLPRPGSAPPLVPPIQGLLLPVGAVAMAVLVAWADLRDPLRGAPAPAPTLDSGLALATWNVHLGFDASWTFDPEGIARTLERVGATVVGLQEVPAGLPFLQGTDLALWLGRRLGQHDYFAPSTASLLGDAFLGPAAVERFAAARLPGPDPRQVAVLAIPLPHGSLPVYMTRLGLGSDVRAVQASALLALIPDGPAVLLGDFNAEEADPEIGALAAAGFRDALAVAGANPSPTYPADEPRRRIDWIWVRGLEVASAEVLESRASDHRPVRASVAFPTAADAASRVSPP